MLVGLGRLANAGGPHDLLAHLVDLASFVVCLVRVELEVEKAYLHGRNLITDSTFTIGSDEGGTADLYLTDDGNYRKYAAGDDFSVYEMNESASSATIISYLSDDDHIILSNLGCINTEKLVSFNITVYSLPTVLITSPDDLGRALKGESGTRIVP